MISVGVDAHKRVHVSVAVDEQGRECARWRGPNSPRGWDDFAAWLSELGGPARVGVEGAGGYGRGLAQYLVGRGEHVYEVNARWTAIGRRSARQRGKNDRLDATAVALFVHREAAGLPEIAPDDETVILDLLATERASALGEATRLRNQIHALLLQLDPEYRSAFPTLKSKRALASLRRYRARDTGALAVERAAIVRSLAVRLTLATSQAEELGRRIRALAAAHFAPLTAICGVDLLTAGTLAGILGPGHRFANDAALAAYAGAAPLEASSASRTRHRLNRGGNRRLNAVLYLIALTQARHSRDAQAYLERRLATGKTKREAMRALKRFIVRAIWRAWTSCLAATDSPTARSAA